MLSEARTEYEQTAELQGSLDEADEARPVL